jgi:threonine dehydratase
VGLAALLGDRARFANAKVGIVLSGGNIDPLMMTDIVGRGMVRGGRLTRLQVELRDQPGALAKVSAMLAEVNANIVEVHHERAFTHLPVQSAVVDFVLQTRGHDHVKQIVSVLDAAGFKPKLRND